MFDIYEKLAYGNLNKESLGYVNKPDNIFTDAYEKFTTKDFPRLKEAEKEIQEVMDFMENAQSTKCWDNYKSFMIQCDEDIRKTLELELKRLEIPYNKEYGDYLENIQETLGVLIMRLKQHYNRKKFTNIKLLIILIKIYTRFLQLQEIPQPIPADMRHRGGFYVK